MASAFCGVVLIFIVLLVYVWLGVDDSGASDVSVKKRR